MEQLLYCDSLALVFLQDWLYRLPHMETIAAAVTRLGDPRYAYLVVFPAVYWSLGPSPGFLVLLAAGVAEWCNIVLKWLLLGNRPYWWVWLHTDWPHLLHQSPLTCETGPGNPSGHVMITMVVLMTAVDQLGRGGTGSLRRLVWLTVSVIGLSRLLISSHFLHQILCGLVFGSLIHTATSHTLPALLPPATHWASLSLLTAFLMILLALSTFHVWTWLGMDPGFSIPLAEKYCANREWVRVDTTPLFSLMRSAGTVVGVASTTALRPLSHRARPLHKLSGFLISLLLFGCLEMVPKATNIMFFYIQSFCTCAIIPLLVGVVQSLSSFFHNIF